MDDSFTRRLDLSRAQLSSELERRFGRREHYSDDEVRRLLGELSLDPDLWEYVAVMFSDPEEDRGFLQSVEKSQTTKEVAKLMSGRIAGGMPGNAREADAFDEADDGE